MGIFDRIFGKKSKDSEVKDVGIEKKEVKKKSEQIKTKESTEKKSTVTAEDHLRTAYTLWHDKKKLEEAIKECKAAIKVNPNFAMAHRMLADIYDNQNKLDDAIRSYKDALNIDPDYALARSNLGMVYHLQGNDEAAIKEWEETLRRGVDSTMIKMNTEDFIKEARERLLKGGKEENGKEKQSTVKSTEVMRLVDNGDGTVTDNIMDLIWQKEDDGKQKNYKGALEYCESLNLGGYDDWRLPRKEELMELADLGYEDLKQVFPNIKAERYWAKTSREELHWAQDPDKIAYTVDFDPGSANYGANVTYFRSHEYYVRAVRQKKSVKKDVSEKKVTYKLTETCLGNPLDIEVTTEKFCIYCKHLSQPDFGDPSYPKGFAGCKHKGEVSLDDSCERWEPNTKVREWLSKGCMEHNIVGWPRKPWYQVFDDGPDGEKGAR